MPVRRRGVSTTLDATAGCVQRRQWHVRCTPSGPHSLVPTREVKLMAHAPSPQSGASGSRLEARELLFKPDHPRAIDQYIHYFGGGDEAAAETDGDRCGETLLERLA